jgi:hypothetical protein
MTCGLKRKCTLPYRRFCRWPPATCPTPDKSKADGVLTIQHMGAPFSQTGNVSRSSQLRGSDQVIRVHKIAPICPRLPESRRYVCHQACGAFKRKLTSRCAHLPLKALLLTHLIVPKTAATLKRWDQVAPPRPLLVVSPTSITPYRQRRPP